MLLLPLRSSPPNSHPPPSPLTYVGIDEVNLFKDDDTVIHFSNPKVQMSNGTNCFVVSGNAGSSLPLAHCPTATYAPRLLSE